MNNAVAPNEQAKSHNFDSIPIELRQYPSWVLWAMEQHEGDTKPTKVPYCPNTKQHASVDQPDTWTTFNLAKGEYEKDPARWAGIGFVLTDNDPYAFIDLDDTRHLTNHDELLERQRTVFNGFDSYAELSPSGRGLHIICKGQVDRGRKRAQIEIYSTLRFMTMTGDVYRAAPIVEEDAKCKMLWNAMGGAAHGPPPAFGPQIYEDAVIIERMFVAKNGEKTRDLYEGRWQKHSASWSEADLALINNIVFFTKHRQQIIRIFHSSKLATRKKAYRVDYLDGTIELAFDRVLPTVNIDAILEQLDAMIDAAKSPAIPETDLPRIIDIREFGDYPPRPRGFVIEGLIPERTVTLWGGDGVVGKSLAATQAGFAIATGRRAFGSETRAGSCLFITAEDEESDLHWRLAMIAKHEGVNLRDVEPERMGVWSFAGHDAQLVVGNGRGGIVPTLLFAAVRDRIDAMRPTLVVLDTSADLFGGEENNRNHVRQFIGMLRATAIDFDTTIALLSHPSLTGMSNGSGLSGSTAWNNSVRARLYMKRDPNDPATTILSVMKSNYGPTGEQIRLEWRNGVFATLGRDKDANAHKVEQEGSVDDVFLALLSEFAENDKYVVRVPNSPDYAPKVFAKNSRSHGYSKPQFVDAMLRLFANHRIGDGMVGPYPSKMKKVIVASPTSGSISK